MEDNMTSSHRIFAEAHLPMQDGQVGTTLAGVVEAPETMATPKVLQGQANGDSGWMLIANKTVQLWRSQPPVEETDMAPKLSR